LLWAGAAAEPAVRQPLRPDDVAYTFGVGTFAPAFEPPPPGTYELPPIDTVRDHAVLDTGGRDTTLGTLIGDRLAVVSFIYGSCAEATGCPVSTAALHRLDRLLADDPALAPHVVLVTVSFARCDTPARPLRELRAGVGGSSSPPATTRRRPSSTTSGSRLPPPSGRRTTGVFRRPRCSARSRTARQCTAWVAAPQLVLNDLRTLRRPSRALASFPSTPAHG
jgi:hypothetical protein